ncbi:MAG: DUF2791 family P-loop domain-containing protein [Chloroflexota bacterium]
MINGRYQLHQKIGQGGMGIVHLATDRLSGETVALKQVFLPLEQLMFNSRPASQTKRELRLALAREFQILAGLRHPNIISVLDYGFDENGQPFFAMSSLENAQTIVAAANGRSLPEKINLLIQMLQALAYLHRRGILHRDLKPDNVLVVGDTVRVLDFGLAAAKEQATDSVGSWLYMAPELLLGQPASEASDLYAVGVLAYQLFTNEHPFNIYAEDSVGEILEQEPDWQKIQTDDNTTGTSPTVLPTVVRTLLAKKPAQRYPSAQAAIAALSQVLGQNRPAESQSIRESYLQAAAFVGREAELAQLTEALKQAKVGNGSAWLVEGESGVGKSRLLHELRTQALVDGFVVLRGQGVEDSGGLPYQLWREPLRHLLLALPDVSDFEAAVLQPLVPDVAHLLGRRVAPAPYLQGEAAQIRLVATIAQLVGRVKRPLLLLLEDLHWTQASLLPIPHITQHIETMPLLLVGTHRDDERTEMNKRLPDMQPLPLARLTAQEMGALSIAMLGEAGQRDDIVELLQRETEGNAFFAVEVVRALAEEIGSLSQIATMSLPPTLLPNGIQSVVERFLARIPRADQPLLQLAAVAGRKLDTVLLQRLNGNRSLTRWLSLCAEAAVLEIVDDGWQFRHAKIRDGLLAHLSPATVQTHHQEVAQTIEDLYPNDPQHAASLMVHWREAGSTGKERYYALAAGRHAAEQYDNSDALIFFTRAYELASTAVQISEALLAREKLYALVGDSAARKADLDRLAALMTVLDDHQQIEVWLRRGSYAMTVSQFAEAATFAETAVQQAQASNAEPLLVRAYYQHGQALAVQGQVEPAQTALMQALILAQCLEDSREIANLLTQLGSIASRKGAYEKASDYLHQSLQIYQDNQDKQGEANARRLLGHVALDLTHYQEAEEFFRHSLKIGQLIGDKQGESWASNALALLYDETGRYSDAKFYLEQALALEKSIGNKAGIGTMYNNLGVFFYAQQAYDKAYDYFAESLAIAEETGELMGTAVALLNLGSTFRERHGVYEMGERHLQRGWQLVRNVEANDLEASLLMHLGGLYKRVGQYIIAKPRLDQALAAFRQIGRRWWEAWTMLYLSEWFVAQGDYAAAQEHFVATMAIDQELNNDERIGAAANGLGWVAYLLNDYTQMERYFAMGLTHGQKGRAQHETAVSQAGLAVASLLLGRPDTHASHVETCLSYLTDKPKLMASETPFRLYLLCCQWLQENRDTRAQELLAAAYEKLQLLADHIETPIWRQSYLQSVPENKEIVRLYRAGKAQ